MIRYTSFIQNLFTKWHTSSLNVHKAFKEKRRNQTVGQYELFPMWTEVNLSSVLFSSWYSYLFWKYTVINRNVRKFPDASSCSRQPTLKISARCCGKLFSSFSKEPIIPTRKHREIVTEIWIYGINIPFNKWYIQELKGSTQTPKLKSWMSLSHFQDV